MPLTIAQIVQVSAPVLLQAANRPHYRLGLIVQPTYLNAYRTGLYDDQSNAGVSITWSREQEIQLQSERARIDFVRALLMNAITSLDFYIMNRGAPVMLVEDIVEDDVQDVTYE